MSGFLGSFLVQKVIQIRVRAIIYIVLQVPRVEVHQTCQFCNYQDTIFQFCPQLQYIRAASSEVSPLPFNQHALSRDGW